MSLVKRQKTGESGSLINYKGTSKSPGLYSEAVVLEGHDGVVLSAKFSNDGNHIASGGGDQTIQLWNLPTDKDDESPNYGVLKGHKSAVTSLRWSKDDNFVATSSADASIGIWDVATGKRVRKGTGHELAVNEIEISSDSLVLSVGDDGSAKIWDQREKLPVSVVDSPYPVMTGTFNKAGSVIYLGGIDPKVRAFDIRQIEKPIWECDGQTSSITSLALNHDGSVLLSRAMDGKVRTYSAKDEVSKGLARLSPYVLDGALGNEYDLIRAKFSNNNVSIISGSNDNTATIWDYNSRKITKKLVGHNGTVLDVDYHPSDKFVLSTSTDGTIIVREL